MFGGMFLLGWKAACVLILLGTVNLMLCKCHSCASHVDDIGKRKLETVMLLLAKCLVYLGYVHNFTLSIRKDNYV